MKRLSWIITLAVCKFISNVNCFADVAQDGKFLTNSNNMAAQNSVVAGSSNTLNDSGISVGAGNHHASSGSSFGQNNYSSGLWSFSAGRWNYSTGAYSSSFGYSNYTAGSYSFTAGLANGSYGNNSAAIGYANDAIGSQSIALGKANIADGDNAVAIGENNIVTGKSWVLGSGNEGVEGAVVVGVNNDPAATDAVFVVGSGAYPVSEARRNALIVKTDGSIIMSVPQGDISMGVYGSQTSNSNIVFGHVTFDYGSTQIAGYTITTDDIGLQSGEIDNGAIYANNGTGAVEIGVRTVGDTAVLAGGEVFKLLSIDVGSPRFVFSIELP